MNWLYSLLATRLGLPGIITTQETIMATQVENQRRIDELTSNLEASDARQDKAHAEILSEVTKLREQAAAGEQDLDFTGIEAAAGKLTGNAEDFDAVVPDAPAEPETPADPAPETGGEETPPPADPLADGATAGDSNPAV